MQRRFNTEWGYKIMLLEGRMFKDPFDGLFVEAQVWAVPRD